jgi:hypothetical protein
MLTVVLWIGKWVNELKTFLATLSDGIFTFFSHFFAPHISLQSHFIEIWKPSTFPMEKRKKKVPRVNDDLLFAKRKTGMSCIHLKILILEIFLSHSFVLRFDFVDWEKLKRAHNFHPITGNVKRGRDRSNESHVLRIFRSRTNDKIYTI